MGTPNSQIDEITKDSERYNWLRVNMYMTIGNALKWGTYPSPDDKPPFDYLIDKAMIESLNTNPIHHDGDANNMIVNTTEGLNHDDQR